MLSAVEAELNAHPLPFEFEVRLPSARDPEGLPGGASLVFQLIHHCPWCGERLPESVRHAWFDRLDALGLEPEDELPDELAADDWWKRELDS